MEKNIAQYLAKIGRNGGKKSRRVLRPGDAKDMVKVREAKRAFKNFYSQCFWSFNKDLVISKDKINWVAEQLKKNGNRNAWEIAKKLCQ